jgi:hypothetical protein
MHAHNNYTHTFLTPHSRLLLYIKAHIRPLYYCVRSNFACNFVPVKSMYTGIRENVELTRLYANSV